MSLIVSIVLGIVQGISEFLPLSSSGHISILESLFKLNQNGKNYLFFEVLLNFGTLISAFIVYRKEIRTMFRESIDFFNTGRNGKIEEGIRFTPSVRTAFLMLIATLPLFAALLFYKSILLLFNNISFIGFALLVTGTIIFISGKLVIGRKNAKTVRSRDALMIGIAQACALLPGISRTGTTIAMGLTYGLDRDFAVRFSLLLSIPAAFITNIVYLFPAIREGVAWSELPLYIVGLISAAVTGYFAIGFLKSMTERGKFGRFAYYCWIVGALTVFLSIIL